jgi:cytidine deaminase
MKRRPAAGHAALVRAARAARAKAYAPYSGFLVGAAVLCGSGRVYTGCNVENASYGLTCCAERTAIFKAAAAGERRVRAVAVVLDAPSYGAPCGACRQVIHEFGPDATVIMATVSGASAVRKIRQLLPYAFGPGNLDRARGKG